MISFFRKLSWLTGKRKREDQLSAELRFHMEEEAEEFQEGGLSQEDAQWAARREIGNLGAVREQTRAIWTWTLLEQLVQDLRYAARTMRHTPAFTIVAALSLGLGIGANTAIYSFMDALLLRSLPVLNPTSLVVLTWHITGRQSIDDSVVHNVSGHIDDDPKTGKTSAIFPYPAFEVLNKSRQMFSVLFAYRPARKLNVMIQSQAEIENGEYVSGEYFRGLAVAPAAGRLIGSDDDRAGATAVVVLSYAVAQRQFGTVASAAGKTVRINNIPFTVIGVAPPGFLGVDAASVPDFYLPMHTDLLLTNAGFPGAGPGQRYLDEHYYWVEMMGRLRADASMMQAQATLRPVFDQWVSATAANDRERKNLPSLLLKSGAAGSRYWRIRCTSYWLSSV